MVPLKVIVFGISDPEQGVMNYFDGAGKRFSPAIAGY